MTKTTRISRNDTSNALVLTSTGMRIVSKDSAEMEEIIKWQLSRSASK